MDNIGARKAMEQAAKMEGIDQAKYIADIQVAIDAGFDNPDPKVQALWKTVPYKGARPTPEEVICFLTEQVRMSEKEKHSVKKGFKF